MSEAQLPADDPGGFIGQASLVRRIYSRIGADRPQSVAVIGGKRSGKTALLAHLGAPAVAAAWLEHPGDYVFLRCAAQSAGGETPGRFLATLAAGLPPAAASEPNPYEDLRIRIEARHAEGLRMVVLLDDFHCVTGNERFPLEFFSFLRSMANNYNLAYVTASVLELQKLCVAKEVQESPFFNIFTNMHLGMLARADACALVIRLAGADPELAGRLVDWLGASPYLLRMAAAWLGGFGEARWLGEADFRKGLYPLVEPHFREVVACLPPEALRPLQAIGRDRAPQPSDLHQVGDLVKQGFLLENDQGRLGCAPAFAQFLRHGLEGRMLRGGC